MEQGLASTLSKDFDNVLESVRKSIPVNIRTFVGTLTNDTSPISEKNFSSEDLTALSDIYKRKKKSRNEELKYLQGMLNNYKNADTGISWKSVDGALVDNSKELLRDLQKRADNLKSKKFPITYKDYPTTGEDSGWVKQLYSSFADPDYRLATTLGQFNASEDDKGNIVVEDTYDWTTPENATPIDFIKSIPSALSSPEKLGNLAVRAFKPKTARDVKIVIPKGG